MSQARWRIEFFLKRITHWLDVHRPRCVQPEHVQAEILASLLAWALQEEDVVAIPHVLQHTVEEPATVPSVGLLPEPTLGTVGCSVNGC